VIAYIDTSALLRIVLREPGALDELRSSDGLVSSELIAVESARTLDRLRLTERHGDEVAAERREAVFRLMEAMEIVEIGHAVLARASQPLPTALGTLDAIHLATALLWKERAGVELAMATHDAALATAARASGLPVLGI